MFSWSVKSPPNQHWIMAAYDDLDKPMLVKTCNEGCCVVDPFKGALTLPIYWREATPDEIQNVELDLQYEVSQEHFKMPEHEPLDVIDTFDETSTD